MVTLLRTALRLAASAVLALGAAACSAADAVPGVVVIGHAGVKRLDLDTVQRMFTGRIVELGGVPVTVVNARPGSALRDSFMASVLNQRDDEYRAYWTVRRHVGKGTPPRDLDSAAAIIQFVQATPGAVGYIDGRDLVPGLNVVARP